MIKEKKVKEVDFVEINVRKVQVMPMNDYYNYHRIDARPAVIMSSQEVVPELDEKHSVKIERVVNDGVESYFSVDKSVWEKLCLFDNPVTVESLINERDKHKKESIQWQSEANYLGNHFSSLKQHCFNAGLLQRIKWVFTGFKY